MERENFNEFSHVAGSMFLDGQSLEERREAGRVFTPPHLVRFILGLAEYRAGNGILDKPVLDPGCGTGAFLEQIVAELAEELRLQGHDLSRVAGHRRLEAAIRANIWGVDLDESSCSLTREAIEARVLNITGRTLGDDALVENIISADFLLDPAVDRLPVVANARLAYVAGNPPYVSATRIPNDSKQQLRARFRTATGRLDLYILFIERSLELLPPGGRMALITPDKYLTSRSAHGLRALLSTSNAVRVIGRFDSHKVFAQAATVPCVTIVDRNARRAAVNVLDCRHSEEGGPVVVLRSAFVPANSLDAAPWNLSSPDIKSLAARLCDGHQTLGDACERISAGPATGRDSIFLLGAGEAGLVEEDLLRPAVRGRDIGAYTIKESGLKILLPFEFGTGNARLVDLKRYRNAARYLASHREDLKGRHCVTVWEKAWYDFHDRPPGDLAHRMKLVVPDVADSNRFAVDRGLRFPLHSAYYLIPREGLDIDYLAGVLNSSIGNLLVRAFAPRVKDGFSRYRRQFLKGLPVPAAPAPMRRKIARAAGDGDQRTVDELVFRLFGMAPGELLPLLATLRASHARAA